MRSSDRNPGVTPVRASWLDHIDGRGNRDGRITCAKLRSPNGPSMSGEGAGRPPAQEDLVPGRQDRAKDANKGQVISGMPTTLGIGGRVPCPPMAACRPDRDAGARSQSGVSMFLGIEGIEKGDSKWRISAPEWRL
jgi:hypothetical protein